MPLNCNLERSSVAIQFLIMQLEGVVAARDERLLEQRGNLDHAQPSVDFDVAGHDQLFVILQWSD